MITAPRSILQIPQAVVGSLLALHQVDSSVVVVEQSLEGSGSSVAYLQEVGRAFHQACPTLVVHLVRPVHPVTLKVGMEEKACPGRRVLHKRLVPV